MTFARAADRTVFGIGLLTIAYVVGVVTMEACRARRYGWAWW